MNEFDQENALARFEVEAQRSCWVVHVQMEFALEADEQHWNRRWFKWGEATEALLETWNESGSAWRPTGQTVEIEEPKLLIRRSVNTNRIEISAWIPKGATTQQRGQMWAWWWNSVLDRLTEQGLVSRAVTRR